VVFLVELLQEVGAERVVAEFGGRGGEDASDAAFAGLVVAGVELVGADEVDEVDAAVGVVFYCFFAGEGPVAVCDVWEVGGAKERVDAVCEGAGQAGDLDSCVSAVEAVVKGTKRLTVKPVSSLRMGSIVPSGSVNSVSRACSNLFFRILPYSLPNRRSVATIPPIATRLCDTH
jgi:hypothetical protein